MKDKREFVLSVIHKVAQEDFDYEFEWVETYADRVRYRNDKAGNPYDFALGEIGDIIDDLAFTGELFKKTDPMWRDDKVRPNTNTDFSHKSESKNFQKSDSEVETNND